MGWLKSYRCKFLCLGVVELSVCKFLRFMILYPTSAKCLISQRLIFFWHHTHDKITHQCPLISLAVFWGKILYEIHRLLQKLWSRRNGSRDVPLVAPKVRKQKFRSTAVPLKYEICLSKCISFFLKGRKIEVLFGYLYLLRECLKFVRKLTSQISGVASLTFMQ